MSERIVGTVTVNGMFDPNRQRWARATPEPAPE